MIGVLFINGCLTLTPEQTEAIMVWNEGPFDPPAVMKSSENSITVRYTSAGASVQHDEAEKMIREHCGGGFTGKRFLRDGWYVVEARCK